ncbi:DUF7666 domain-containing protein [Blautia sp. AM47-4]|uniref:DUF7666 domain-containing protein n=1 Tax=Blautia sp. AM47-4 TaxID=2292979 RepID=UPI003FA4A550
MRERFSCGGKQCEENTTYEEYGEGCCYKGVMHFYEDPWEVLNHYDLVDGNGNLSEFAEVEALGQVWNDGEKRATNKIHVGEKLGLKGFLKACIDFTLEKTNGTNLSGDSAQIGSSGDSAQIGSSGNSAQIGSSGNCAKINSTGEDAVIMCAGRRSKAKGKKGSWITLAEWVKDEEKGRYVPICVKTERVDGEKIKEDTYYTLKNGEFSEVEE